MNASPCGPSGCTAAPALLCCDFEFGQHNGSAYPSMAFRKEYILLYVRNTSPMNVHRNKAGTQPTDIKLVCPDIFPLTLPPPPRNNCWVGE